MNKLLKILLPMRLISNEVSINHFQVVSIDIFLLEAAISMFHFQLRLHSTDFPQVAAYDLSLLIYRQLFALQLIYYINSYTSAV